MTMTTLYSRLTTSITKDSPAYVLPGGLVNSNMIVTSDTFTETLNSLPKVSEWIIDVETNGLNPYDMNQICGIGLVPVTNSDSQIYYFPFRHQAIYDEPFYKQIPSTKIVKTKNDDGEVINQEEVPTTIWTEDTDVVEYNNLSQAQLNELVGFINDNCKTLIGYNVKFDAKFLENEGINVPNMNLVDVLVMVRMTEPTTMNRLSLTDTIIRSYGENAGLYDVETKKILRKHSWNKNFAAAPPYYLGPYCVEDVYSTRKVNQEILPPLEKEANFLHKQRMKLIKGAEPGNVPKEVSKKLEDINIKLSNISLKTNGALQAVLIDEKNLKPFVFNKNYANVIGQGLIDKPVKDLSKADLDFIKSTFPQAAKIAKKEFRPGMQPDGQLKDLPGGNRKGLNLGLLKGAGETIKAIPTLAGGLALNLAFQPDLSSGVDRAALGAEAAFAPELVRQASRVTSNPIVQRFFNLGLSPQMAMRAARVASPIGLATLAGEGLYQAGKYAIDRRKELQSMSPVERDRLRQESDAFSFNEFSAAGGGIAKLAGKSSGRPPESGPTPQGLDFLIKRGRQS